MSTFYTNVKVINDNICYRGIENGLPVKFKCKYSPKVYIKSNKESLLKTLEGDNVVELKFGVGINETKDLIKQYSEVDNFEILGDIGFDTQYISDKFKGVVDFDIDKISIHICDIETSTELGGFPNALLAEEEILLISMLDIRTQLVTVFTARPYNGKSLENVTIILCEDEKSLLRHFIDYWNRVAVDVVSGWRSNTFDIPFIINRISRILGDSCAKELSPWGMITSKSIKGKFGKEETTYDIAGVACIDMLDLYKKYTYVVRENYTLDFISQEELGEGKLKNPFSTFKEFYSGECDIYKLDPNETDELRQLAYRRTILKTELVKRGIKL
jgi:DNA polymerase elongation subunit (family B)